MCAKYSKEEIKKMRETMWETPYIMKCSLVFGGPCYYADEHGLTEIKGIIDMSKLIMTNIHMSDYMDAIRPRVIILPVAAPKELLEQGCWKEHRHVEKCGICSISLHMDYDAFVAADADEKAKLFFENVFESFRAIRKRLGRKFNNTRLECDIKELLKKNGYTLDI